MKDVIKKLRDELVNDPASIGYDLANDTDQELADKLNAMNRTFNKPVTSAELLAWAGADSRYMKLKNAAESHASDAIKSVAFAALTMIERDGTTLDLDKADRVALVDALVATGVLVTSDKTALEALALETNKSRAYELDLVADDDDLIYEGHIKQARTLV